jgi:hypothetical protein
MCCDICPYYEECQELDKLQENCCAECPDYSECIGGEGYEEELDEEETEEFNE